MTTPLSIEGLRRGLFDAHRDRPPTGACPAPDALWAAAHGEGDRAAAAACLDHASGCPTCAEAWSIALRAERAAGHGDRRFRRFPVVAAAAAMLTLVAVFPVARRAFGDPALRGADATAIETSIDTATPLPRDACELEWSAGPAGTRYALIVTDENLRTIHKADDLEAARSTITPDALASVPPSGHVLWRVEATLPDGTVVASETFVARIE